MEEMVSGLNIYGYYPLTSCPAPLSSGCGDDPMCERNADLVGYPMAQFSPGPALPLFQPRGHLGVSGAGPPPGVPSSRAVCCFSARAQAAVFSLPPWFLQRCLFWMCVVLWMVPMFGCVLTILGTL